MGRLVSVFLLILLTVILFFFFRNDNLGLLSPIPRVWGVSQKATTSNNWFPKKGHNSPDSFVISAKSALLVDYDSGEILFAKDIDKKLPVASTVKIITALVALENGKSNNIFTVSDKAAKIGENSMNLGVGEKVNLSDLLYGLMLPSGNDAAVTIAEGIAGSEEKFVEMMNERAKEIGLLNTKFINASGLDEDGKEQYSTAYDMATLAHFVWQTQPELREVTSTYHKEIVQDGNHKFFDLYNETNLLTTYPGVLGIKPGFTWESGLCLVTYAENGGKRLIGVILGSDDRRGEMKELLDYGFGKYGIRVSHPALDL